MREKAHADFSLKQFGSDRNKSNADGFDFSLDVGGKQDEPSLSFWTQKTPSGMNELKIYKIQTTHCWQKCK